MRGIVGLLLALASFVADAAEIAGTYSSFAYAADGDVDGAEMFITHGAAEHFATIQCSAGAPGDPLLLKVRVNENIVEFSVPEESSTGCRPGKYKAVVTENGLTLTHQKTKWTNMLKRGKSFWTK